MNARPDDARRFPAILVFQKVDWPLDIRRFLDLPMEPLILLTNHIQNDHPYRQGCSVYLFLRNHKNFSLLALN